MTSVQNDEDDSAITVDSGELDSGLGDDDRASLTTSIRSSILESVKENGRSYHRYRSTADSEYMLPEDEGEQDRLDLQHETFLRTFDGKLYLSPLSEDISEILDLGTGTGIWAMDFADQHPQCRVTGTDLSPIQPALVPPNCIFEVDDFNAEWTFDQKFDFIHARTLVGSSKNFPYLIQQSFDALKPGGYLEMSDVYVPFQADDDSMKDTQLQMWIDRQMEACAIVGIDSTAPAKNKQWLIDQGFEDVTEVKYKWPVGQWAKDPGLKHIGKLTLLNFYSGLEGITLRLWTGVLGISYEETLATLANVRKDITNPKIHCYWPVYCVYGRKPLDAGDG